MPTLGVGGIFIYGGELYVDFCGCCFKLWLVRVFFKGCNVECFLGGEGSINDG